MPTRRILRRHLCDIANCENILVGRYPVECVYLNAAAFAQGFLQARQAGRFDTRCTDEVAGGHLYSVDVNGPALIFFYQGF